MPADSRKEVAYMGGGMNEYRRNAVKENVRHALRNEE